MVRISFKDSGFGIPNEIKDRIFEPFFTTKPVKGTGLGLAICNEIINKYHGRIEVHSSSGEGSTFNVLIPEKYLEHVQ
jgi:signal transduction histidine kinase